MTPAREMLSNEKTDFHNELRFSCHLRRLYDKNGVFGPLRHCKRGLEGLSLFVLKPGQNETNNRFVTMSLSLLCWPKYNYSSELNSGLIKFETFYLTNQVYFSYLNKI